ncbi:MAG: hypothetical protein KGD70_12030 [Candidatus Lokiarchaeota archaeon]|nr:hypothetical protein [Candidatus Lokiarchaeota archaeon]
MEGLTRRVKSKKKKFFKISKSIISLDKILNQCLPLKDECVKLISFDGGFSSISFISLVAQKENIKELTASTLRIGEKQFIHLARLKQAGKLDKATFFLSSIMKEDNKKKDKYNYYSKFEEVCKTNGWEKIVINNHSKIILMCTDDNYYVLETSSNLNENPKIEQYSFENDKELYDFYYNFFTILKER